MTLTKTEVETLRTILRLGGKVIPTMGKAFAPNVVRTSIVNRLVSRGIVRAWTAPRRVGMRNGRYLYEHDLAVTAVGCRALETHGC